MPISILSVPQREEMCGFRFPISGWKDVEGMTKILLVEDSKFLRMATERALARAGYVGLGRDAGD